MLTTNVLYRYEIEYKSEDGDTSLYLRELPVIQETDKTYLVDNHYRRKRVRKDAYNSFAYTQKDKALNHLIRRTNKRVGWFEFWIEECNKALVLVSELKAGNNE